MTWDAAVALVIAMAPPAVAQTRAGADLLAALPGRPATSSISGTPIPITRAQDQPPVNLDDCATQRVLSREGTPELARHR